MSRKVTDFEGDCWKLCCIITCIYSHARWIRNATTIICYTPSLEDCSTIISFRRYPTLILHTRPNRIKLESHRTETGTLTITERQLYPRFHARPMAGHLFDTLGKFWSNLGSGSGKEDITTTEWEEPRSRIVHALVACYRGRIGYKEACFPLICSLSVHHLSLLSLSVLSYSSLPFDHFTIVHFFDKFFVWVIFFYICYIQSTCVNPYLNSEFAVPEPCCWKETTSRKFEKYWQRLHN